MESTVTTPRIRFALVMAVAFLALCLIAPATTHAQGDIFLSGFVIDLRDETDPTQEFVNEFNNASLASGHPIFLMILGQEDLYDLAWKVGIDKSNQDDINAYLPPEVIIIVVAPDVPDTAPEWENSTSGVIGDGRYLDLSRLTATGADLSDPDAPKLINEYVGQAVEDLVYGNPPDTLAGVLEGVRLLTIELEAADISSPGSQIPAVPAGPVNTVPTSAPAPTARPQSNPSQTTQPQGGGLNLWPFCLAALGFLGLGGLGTWGYRASKNSRRRSAAQREAQLAYGRVEDRVIGFEQSALPIGISIAELTAATSDATSAPFTARLDAARQEVSQANAELQRLRQTYRGTPDGVNLTVNEYNSYRDSCLELGAQLDNLESVLQLIRQEASELRLEAESLPRAIENARSAYDETLSEYQQLARRFAVPAIGEQLQSILGLINSASGERDTGNIAGAVETVQQALDLLNTVARAIAGIDQRYVDLTNDARVIEADFGSIETARLEAATALTRLQAEYARGAWDDLENNATRAGNALADARSAYNEATALTRDTPIALDELDRLLDLAHKLQQDAGQLCNVVIELEVELRDAAGRTPELVSRARQAVAAARQLFSTYDTLIRENLESRLLEAENLASQADQLHREPIAGEGGATINLAMNPRPDYLEINRMAVEAAHIATEIRATAMGEIEAMQDAERNAQEEIALAVTAVNTADRYIESNIHNTTERTEEQFREAERSLTAAQTAMTTAASMPDGSEQQRLQLYQTASAQAIAARKLAMESYEAAKKEVKAASEHAYSTPSYPSGGYSNYSGSGGTTVIVTSTSSGSASPSPRRERESTRRDDGWSSTTSWQPRPSRPSTSSSTPRVMSGGSSIKPSTRPASTPRSAPAPRTMSGGGASKKR